MLKNTVIFLLVGALAFFLVSDRKLPEAIENREVDSIAITPTVPEDTSSEKLSGDTLNLSSKGLDKLPASVLSRTSLEGLDISDNNLTGALPAEIRHLKNLRVLDASNNKMTGVPAEIGQLEKLEVLDLSNNQLTGLPYEMGNLKNLKRLNLAGNDYAQQDLDIIRRGLPSDVELVL